MPFGRHPLSKGNQSLQDLTILNSLVDDRTGYYEEQRVTDEFISKATKGKKNGSEILAYYERMNGILDGWREVDEILDSQFLEEVMRRFGTVEEVERMKNGKRKKMTWLAEESDGEDSGYQEESEISDEEGAAEFKRRESLATRAASALSGFWFGSSTPNPHRGKGRLRDEESRPLVASPSQETPPQINQTRSSYGALKGYKIAGSGLTPIEDTNEANTRSPTSPPRVGAVHSNSSESGKPGAVEHNPDTLKQEAKARNKETRRSLIVKKKQQAAKPISNSDTDDELDSDDGDSEPIEAGKLDRKIAEERKARAKHRDVVVPGSGGQVIRIAGRSVSAGKENDDKRRKIKRETPGGLSERERVKLLEHIPGRAEKEDERERGAKFAININLAVNVLLLAGKAFAVISSNSVSLLASLVDSALDFLSTIIIFGTSKAIAYRSWNTYFKYPVGKKRFEPLGVVIFSVLMIASFCQVLVESGERLWAVLHRNDSKPSEMAQLPLVGIIFMVLTIIIKAFMWAIYRKSPSSGVRAVAQDAENDVVFNTASLIFPVIGDKLGWPALDPIGGILLSIYIIWEWIETLTETVNKLSGSAASPDALTRALYLITRFKSIDSVSALEVYHAGDDMIVEVDVVLPMALQLKEAHDLGEIVTYCLESIGHERAFVHLDYNPTGQRGHISGRG
ncbi:hypothetical protein CBS101457_006697 [Exobasidium rhododendri]|nr:hypothetical protein CBS101457_006697 [Exobasidium rhododendri]